MEFCVIITNNENLGTANRTAMVLKCNTNKYAHCHVRQLLTLEKWGNAEKRKTGKKNKLLQR